MSTQEIERLSFLNDTYAYLLAIYVISMVSLNYYRWTILQSLLIFWLLIRNRSSDFSHALSVHLKSLLLIPVIHTARKSSIQPKDHERKCSQENQRDRTSRVSYVTSCWVTQSSRNRNADINISKRKMSLYEYAVAKGVTLHLHFPQSNRHFSYILPWSHEFMLK